MEISYVLVKYFVLISNENTVNPIVLLARNTNNYDAEIFYFGSVLEFCNVFTFKVPECYEHLCHSLYLNCAFNLGRIFVRIIRRTLYKFANFFVIRKSRQVFTCIYDIVYID